MRKRFLMLAVLVATTVGCFEIQGKHTVYLEPDGTVTWAVLEEEIRLDGETAKERRQAADEFLDLVAANGHAAAVSLAALHPSSLNSRILRDEAPQTILTEARFPGIDRLHQNLFDLYQVPASTELDTDGDLTRMKAWIWLNDSDEEDEEDEEESADVLEAAELSEAILLALLVECRIVLTEGRFVEAVGFEIKEDGRVAVPTDTETEEEDEEDYLPVVLSLTWTSEPEPDGAPPAEGLSEQL
jgi:hypothetical protein